jgi:CheY-like chemotaxis protein/nitrogen-specific signal transduction histidine kinase
VPHRGRSGGGGGKSGRTAARKRRTKARAPPRPRAIEIALAGLAHDIRTPLTGIVALAELLNAADLPEREQRWAEALKGAAEHLARLTNLVVDVAKADATGLVLREEPFALRELVQSAATALTARAEAKGLDATIAIAAALPAHASGDAVRLRSALENLIDNAVKFTERGRIAFRGEAARTSRGRVRVVFTVADSGIGISASDLKRLFRPFSQASEDVARRFGGAGLGLVFVKRIAAAMGGGLTVTSQPGRGSTFRLTVVLREVRVTARSRGRSSAQANSLRVLCVEDNPYGRVVLGTVLRELGHRVSFVGSSEQAVAAVKRNGYDVVLMDIVLGGADGIEAAHRIRRLRGKAGHIPIIGISGRGEPADETAARAAGMNAYLRKPASPALISETLAAVMRVRRA